MEERIFETGHSLPGYQSSATALLLSKDRYVGAFLVDQISVRGAKLVGHRPLRVGEPVTMILQIPERRPVSMDGRVLRQQSEMSGERVLAVAFERLSKQAARLVEEVATPQAEAGLANRGSDTSSSCSEGHSR